MEIFCTCTPENWTAGTGMGVVEPGFFSCPRCGRGVTLTECEREEPEFLAEIEAWAQNAKPRAFQRLRAWWRRLGSPRWRFVGTYESVEGIGYCWTCPLCLVPIFTYEWKKRPPRCESCGFE